MDSESRGKFDETQAALVSLVLTGGFSVFAGGRNGRPVG
jgi:hypothetical protein